MSNLNRWMGLDNVKRAFDDWEEQKENMDAIVFFYSKLILVFQLQLSGTTSPFSKSACLLYCFTELKTLIFLLAFAG